MADQAPTRTARIPLSKLRFHPSNVRRDLGDLSELAASMREWGQLQAVRVHQRGSMFEMLDGHRRLGAARIAGLRTLLAEVVPARSEGRAIAEMLETALHKADLTPGERRDAITRLLEIEGCTAAELATRYGVSQATISRWRSAGDARPAGSPPDTRYATPLSPRMAPADGRRRVHRRRSVHRRRPVQAVKVDEFAARWTERAAGAGLDAAGVAELFDELRALTAPATAEPLSTVEPAESP